MHCNYWDEPCFERAPHADLQRWNVLCATLQVLHCVKCLMFGTLWDVACSELMKMCHTRMIQAVLLPQLLAMEQKPPRALLVASDQQPSHTHHF
jgi:hypothetical protein